MPRSSRGSRDALAIARVLERVSQSRLLDRLVRGRLSIAIVAFALIGIVTLQLGLLKLNSSIGRTLEREAILQRQNSALSIENSEMLAGERVEARAVRLGMRLAPISALRFLSAQGPSAISPVLSALKAPVAAGAASSQHAQEGSGPQPGREAGEAGGSVTHASSESSAQAAGESRAQGGSEPSTGGSGESSTGNGESAAQGAREGTAPAAGASAASESSTQPTGGEESRPTSSPSEAAPRSSTQASGAGGAQAGGG